ncbi:MAG: MerR family transcriptional regulator [Bacteroidales bacterium]
MKRYYIKDVENLTGIKAHTLRVWEQRYDFLKPHRTDTNIRFYDEYQLKKLLNVSLLVSKGQKISKICCLTDDELNCKIKDIYENVDNDLGEQTIPFKINSLIVAMLDMDEVKFSQIVSTSLMKRGMAKTISMVLFPFIQRLQIMWRTGEVSTAQEHFVFNLIRQKLYVAIDSLPLAPKQAKKFVVFLSENSTNDLYILFYIYFLKLEGHQIINLGKDISLSDIKGLQPVVNPDFLFTYFDYLSSPEKIKNVINPIAESFDIPMWVAGDHDCMENLDFLAKNVDVVCGLDCFQKKIQLSAEI